MTEVYADLAKKLITDLYYPGTPQDYDVKFTTGQITDQLKTIIPGNALDDFITLDILQELNMSPGYERKVREKENEEAKIEFYDDFIYYWYFQKINQEEMFF